MATGVQEVQTDDKVNLLNSSEASFIDNLEKDDETETGEDGDGKGKEGEEGKEVKGGKEAGSKDKEGSEEGLETGKGKGEGDEEEELRTLRQISRDQKRELDKVTSQLADVNKKLQEANLISPEEVEKQQQLAEFAARRNEYLEDILEIMKVNPKFDDVEEVVSQDHFDDMVEAMAKVLVEREGGKLPNAIKQIEAEVWAMKNPYKFMYENIKKYHPDYVAKPAGDKGNGEDKDADKGDKGDKKDSDDLTARKVVTSIQDLPGGASGTGGWTAAKIDALDELELDKVPKDIYEKYLRNELK